MQAPTLPQIEFRELRTLIPYVRNARTHSPSQVAELAGSLLEWGWTFPVLADDQGIVAGHGRVLAAEQIYALGKIIRLPGGAEIPRDCAPVLDCTGWTPAQRRAYIIADNRLPLNAAWDAEMLSVELDELRDGGFDLSQLGFASAELSDLIGTANLPPVPIPGDDEIPPAPEAPTTRPGDVWILGHHRLICGDCRDAATIARLIGPTSINLAFTSPPYAKQRQYDVASGFAPISPDEYVEWYAPVSSNVGAHLAPDGSYFINIKPAASELDTDLYVFDLVLAHARIWGWHFATEFCWERNGIPKSVSRRFKNQFEPVYQFVKADWKMRPDAVRHHSENVPKPRGKGAGNTSWAEHQGGGLESFRMSGKQGEAGFEWFGDHVAAGMAYPGNRLPTFAGTHEALGHAAAFPVGLPMFFIGAYTDEGDAVFDPFAGSGSTLIGTARMERVGFACELSPIYCDVIVMRWQKAFNALAVHEASNHSFEQMGAQRLAQSQ